MGKYEVDKEFKMLKGMKLPANPKLLPMTNVFLELMRGRTDFNVKVQKVKIPGYQGEMIPIYIIEPKKLQGIRPCLMDFHGGGFMMKGSPAHFARAKEYAYKLNCTVIFPDYRLIPRYPYPIPLEDCFAAYKCTIDHAEELKIDTKKIAVLGDSAGGNLAAAVTMLAGDRGLPMPCCQMLIYPVLDGRMQTESMKLYTDTPVWDARLTELMWELYLRKTEFGKGSSACETLKETDTFTAYKDANASTMIRETGDKWQKEKMIGYISPAEAEDLTGIPDTYIEVAEFDCLRDEGILFAEKLEEAGIPVELHKVSGSVHGYDVIMGSRTVKKLMEQRLKLLQKYYKSTK